MKNKICFLIVLTILLLVGCQEDVITHKENEGDTMSTVDIYDFAFIKKAPESKKKQDINDVIKIYLIENDSSLDTGFAIDIENSFAYIDPRVGSRGVRTGIEEPVELNSATDLIEILDRHDIQSWKTDYTVENSSDYEDGAAWQLWVQYTDGSVEKHAGSGTDIDTMTPDNYYEFTQDLTEAVERRITTEEDS